MTSPAGRVRETVRADGGVPGRRRQTVTVDGLEVLEARWFTRAELLEHAASGGRLGRPDSIDRYLLHSWLDEAG